VLGFIQPGSSAFFLQLTSCQINHSHPLKARLCYAMMAVEKVAAYETMPSRKDRLRQRAGYLAIRAAESGERAVTIAIITANLLTGLAHTPGQPVPRAVSSAPDHTASNTNESTIGVIVAVSNQDQAPVTDGRDAQSAEESCGDVAVAGNQSLP